MANFRKQGQQHQEIIAQQLAATEVIMTDAASINQTSRRTAWQEQGRCQ